MDRDNRVGAECVKGGGWGRGEQRMKIGTTVIKQ